MQLPPPLILQDVVKHFLVLENDGAMLPLHRLSPDGHAGIVCCYRGLFSRNDHTRLPASFVYGQISCFHDLLATGPTGLLVVVLQPYALHLLTGIPAQQFTDQLISLPLIFGEAGQQLEDQLLNATDHQSRLRSVTGFLAGRLQQHTIAAAGIQHTLRPMYAANGWVQVAQLTEQLHITERQLERMFREQVGLSPKQFLRTIRFRSLLKAMQQQPHATLTQLAYDAGYYDQPHFNREFRMLAGITPKQYMTQARRLALNFMQLPA